MKSIETWINEYGESHQNPTNKLIHWVCVPLIMLSLLALMGEIPFPLGEIYLLSIAGEAVHFNWTSIFLIVCILFYSRLSISITLGMLVVALLMIISISIIRAFDPSVWKLSLSIFIVAWIGQFIGHKIEGQKPSFFEDLQFLLIGPAWLLSFIYNKIGIKL